MAELKKIDAVIDRYYRQTYDVVSEDLVEAILYSVHGRGKRIRPMILLELLEGFGIALMDGHYQVAAAVEMIHTGSLIHDDLPAMDNDDYRRGRLTNHRQFDEATAILAGDSLFLDAFDMVVKAGFDVEKSLALVESLSLSSGTFGMVGGQMLDMKGEEKQLTIEELAAIHANKTGRLLAFPFRAAGILSEQSQEVISHLYNAGLLVGLAFQVRDDILDVTASFEEIGKTPQKDLVAEKSTYPSLLGLEKSYEILNDSLDQALAIFQKIKENQDFNAGQITRLIERLRLNA
ncbi:polyprenyl synthetase family protein [Streptococcus gallinaceus]|uniref:Geranylgeranyl diphosphate synthase type II n=1 Tax=Streptococcus gallinaceus TaxID=165758 RepID=A0ABV2JMP0_9STRE